MGSTGGGLHIFLVQRRFKRVSGICVKITESEVVMGGFERLQLGAWIQHLNNNLL